MCCECVYQLKKESPWIRKKEKGWRVHEKDMREDLGRKIRYLY